MLRRLCFLECTPSLPAASNSSHQHCPFKGRELGIWGKTGCLGHLDLRSPSVLSAERSEGSLENAGSCGPGRVGAEARPACSQPCLQAR